LRSVSDKLQHPLIYLIAGEPSGDQIGSRLMVALRKEMGGAVRFSGIGGPAMVSQGIKSLINFQELGLIGILEILPKAFQILRHVRTTVADIERSQPRVLVTIDSWGFTGRIHRALANKESPIKRMRYVAPQVWAWRPGRAKELASWIDHLLTLLPFEPPLFERHGLAVTWVGHPTLESGANLGDGGAFRQTYGLDEEAPIISLLPGSRRSEVQRLLPIFKATAKLLTKSIKNLCVVIPTTDTVSDLVRGQLVDWPSQVVMVCGNDARNNAFAASKAALAASGSVTIELAMAGVPHVIAYRVNPLSALIFKSLARTRYVNLINVLLQEHCIPEMLQSNCCAETLAKEVEALMEDVGVRRAQLAGFKRALGQLAPSGALPSDLAARAVIDLMNVGT